MKAIVRPVYGPPEVLEYIDVPTPSPADDQVLIKLHAASVNPLDRYLLSGAPWNRIPGMRTKPKFKVLGCDIAGRVEAVGRSVRHFKVGDDVFGVTGFAGNGFAEYVCAPEEKLVLKPAALSFEAAAATPIAAITALQALRDKGGLQPGYKVLVEGASGGVGTFAVQIAKALGAEVTAVCSPRNLEIARRIGADEVIDYTTTDFTRNGRRYDLIVAANAHHSIFHYGRILTADGVLVVVGGALPRILQAVSLGPVLSSIGRRKTRFFVANVNHTDMNYLKHLLETGKITPVIDREYPLSQAADAMRYLAEGHAKGKIVLTVPGAEARF
jgi:NADPH:quinone reductase-like Zn-dependent oxidoreductase